MAAANSTTLWSNSQRRLRRELQEMMNDPLPELTIDIDVMDELDTWYVDLTGAEGTLYAGEKMRLRFRFRLDYPRNVPEVIFVGPHIPEHPHVYSNGHIRLSILGRDWSPVMSVKGICLSIISMLSSCKKKLKPENDESYVQMKATASPLDMKWLYNDNTC